MQTLIIPGCDGCTKQDKVFIKFSHLSILRGYICSTHLVILLMDSLGNTATSSYQRLSSSLVHKWGSPSSKANVAETFVLAQVLLHSIGCFYIVGFPIRAHLQTVVEKS